MCLCKVCKRMQAFWFLPLGESHLCLIYDVVSPISFFITSIFQPVGGKIIAAITVHFDMDVQPHSETWRAFQLKEVGNE